MKPIQSIFSITWIITAFLTILISYEVGKPETIVEYLTIYAFRAPLVGLFFAGAVVICIWCFKTDWFRKELKELDEEDQKTT